MTFALPSILEAIFKKVWENLVVQASAQYEIGQ